MTMAFLAASGNRSQMGKPPGKGRKLAPAYAQAGSELFIFVCDPEHVATQAAVLIRFGHLPQLGSLLLIVLCPVGKRQNRKLAHSGNASGGLCSFQHSAALTLARLASSARAGFAAQWVI